MRWSDIRGSTVSSQITVSIKRAMLSNMMTKVSDVYLQCIVLRAHRACQNIEYSSKSGYGTVIYYSDTVDKTYKTKILVFKYST